MNGGHQAALRNLSAIYNIPETASQDAPSVALAILAQLYGMPLIRDHSARRRFGNELLSKTSGHFDPYSPFVRGLGTAVIMMQEFPHYFRNLNLATDELISKLRGLRTWISICFAMGLATGAGSAVGAGLGRAIETGNVREGLVRGGQRALGYGNASQAIAGRLAGRVAVGAVGAGAVVVTGFIALSYLSARQQVAEIQAILRHRFQNGRLNDEQYRAAFGDAVDPRDLKRYWEYR